MKTDTSQVMNVDCLFYHTIDYIADDWRQQKALAINYKNQYLKHEQSVKLQIYTFRNLYLNYVHMNKA